MLTVTHFRLLKGRAQPLPPGVDNRQMVAGLGTKKDRRRKL